MRVTRVALVLGLFLRGLAATFAADTPSSGAVPAATSGSDRLFLAFAEDAAFIKSQWWEGQLDYAEADPVDITAVRLIAALQPMQDLEVGGRVGFGSSDAPSPFQEGSGATDLDLWLKYRLTGNGGSTDFAIGGLATVPTGDDTAGLGYDAFAFKLFGSMRHRLRDLIVSGNLGVRFNGDGRYGTVDLNGNVSASLGAGVILPLSDKISLVGEATFESERFDGAESDVRLLGGLNWRPFDRGILRGGLAFGLTDGAPDTQVLVSYAYTF